MESQRKAIQEYADKHGYKIVDWKQDDASGASDKRPAFDEILAGTTNPPTKAVIAFKSDRIARETKLYFYYLFLLEKKGIELISTKEEFPEGGDFANIYRALMQFVAEQERKNIALRTGRGRLIKAQYGGYSGGAAPYGYRAENGVLVINDEERPIVEYVFKRRAEGQNNLGIADEMNKLGYKPRRGVGFHNATIISIVNNEPFYRGMYKYGKDGDWVKGVHEPILNGDCDE